MKYLHFMRSIWVTDIDHACFQVNRINLGNVTTIFIQILSLMGPRWLSWMHVRLVIRRLRITKTYLYNFDPLKPHFYVVKLGFTGVYIIFLFLLTSKDCWHSLEPPRRGGSNEYPQSIFWAEIWKISEFLSENFQFFFFAVKISIYLNRRVFVMGFMETWSWNIFYGHSLPSADSRRAVVSFWRKNVHNTGKPLTGLSLPCTSVVRQTDRARHDPTVLTGL